MQLRFVILGSGTSVGVPMVACTCEACQSDDPRDQRYRASALIQWPEGTVVIDTTPEFRLQMLREQVMRLDAVLLTHNHADHVHGLDDIRPFTLRTDRAMPVYGNADTLDWVRQHYAYVWEAKQLGGGLPKMDLHVADAPFTVRGVTFTPIPVLHGIVNAFGFRVGDLAYIPDVSEIPDASRPLLEGLRTLVVDAVRFRPHSTHFHVDRAVEEARRIGAPQTFLTHMNHDIVHAKLEADLPDGIDVAYDGLEIDVEA